MKSNLPLWIMLAGIAYAGYWYSQRPAAPIAPVDTASLVAPVPAPPPPPVVRPTAPAIAAPDHVSLDNAVSSDNDKASGDHITTDNAVSPANDK